MLIKNNKNIFQFSTQWNFCAIRFAFWFYLIFTDLILTFLILDNLTFSLSLSGLLHHTMHTKGSKNVWMNELSSISFGVILSFSFGVNICIEFSKAQHIFNHFILNCIIINNQTMAKQKSLAILCLLSA